MKLKQVLQSTPNTISTTDLDKVERWFDEKGEAARAFQASLEATGAMRDDLLRVVAAVTAIVHGGITRDALIVLLQARMGNQRNGRPMPAGTINEVLTALMSLDRFVTPKAGTK